MRILLVVILAFIAIHYLSAFIVFVLELIDIMRFHIDTRSSRKSRRISD